LDVVPEALPVHTRHLGCNQSGHNDKQHQENATHPNAASRLAQPLGLFVFDQLKRTPQNQERRPEAREQRPETMPMENTHRPQQE